jgi:hypothetical protein
MKNTLLGLGLLVLSSNPALADPLPCFTDQPIAPPYFAEDVGFFLKYGAGSRPRAGGGYDLCANEGGFEALADHTTEVVRQENAAFTAGLRLLSLDAGASGLVARVDASDPTSAEMRIVARPGVVPGTVELSSEVREATGGAAVADGAAVVVSLPVTLAVSRDPNNLRTWYSTGAGWVVQGSIGLSNPAQELTAPALFVGAAIAAEGADRAIARWGVAPALP